MSLHRIFTVEELATDESFRRWTMAPTPELDRYWQQWLQQNPDRAGVAARARELVQAVHEVYKDDLSDDMLRHEIAEITRIAEERKAEGRVPFYRRAVWRAAAVLLLTGGLSWLYYTSHNTITPSGKEQEITLESEMLVKTNATEMEMTVLLSDNSVATLAKGSSIRYPRQFTAQERRVYLTGEAFFDVAKNPEQPFLVYTNETVTKVLGTSFRIKAFEGDNTEMVAVKTGRVSVYAKKEYETSQGSKPAGVILNPNQQVVFNRKENKLEKAAMANPVLLAESAVQKDQVFDDRPVAEAFDALAKIYGINIVYQPETLSNCMISAQFNEENLKQRLNAICQAIDAGYDMEDGRVVIRSKGCN
ncbi:ferric-dicitrate binding protein FerR (iron transport regulator) [Dyadobacter sp. BE34]|uniref:Ferric-dicitrate binding protein FerR (Iron transport regulator) n=1 Tax=Dyadobacter fermentans TaxID=94254 RepID=A0ABU1QZP5_9BACT|nr:MULTISPECIES: FecR domain-containing protein [Dyadobacter]MDR6805765.1 ferric-dicitrate binding protein FerR (iron transport regulator) [Dyadobacter fermentans]MDR7042475.1 ferric-dicitrate binding protein FerR (iron transport regulator) [Dyadobacter sp. BE242]MDR7196787.1 ferric-dicitrate binding protein FerR (iron transport regulator) [Dyadobacter sp. BE34]MDR7215778.1 ferric-dicitrate binding protein FerR (iron transport regulator) [Dyadobacter sp. BE31]MDR7263314.1 ferric-dicitrate bind